MVFNDLALFTTVAERLSFSAAAEQIGAPLSRVSRRIADLEDHLGVKLFERTTRRVRLTEEGRRLLDRCQEPIEALRDIAGFADDGTRPTIRITAPPLAARISVGPKVLSFVAAHPEITVDLNVTNAFLDFYRDNIDLAFRLGPLEPSSLVGRRLWSVPYGFCASAAFVARHRLDAPISIERLANLPAILSRQNWLLEGGEAIRPKRKAHKIDDLDLALQAVRRNLGIAMLPVEMLTPDVRVLELEGASALTRAMFAVYPSKRLLPGRIRALIDFLAEDGAN